MKLIIAALTFTLLTGCATYGTEQRAAVVAAHPEWPEQTRQDVLSGSIRVGMTKDQVLASWGQPCLICRGTRSTSAGDWWEYDVFADARPGIGTHLFFGNDDKLRYWGKQ